MTSATFSWVSKVRRLMPMLIGAWSTGIRVAPWLTTFGAWHCRLVSHHRVDPAPSRSAFYLRILALMIKTCGSFRIKNYAGISTASPFMIMATTASDSSGSMLMPRPIKYGMLLILFILPNAAARSTSFLRCFCTSLVASEMLYSITRMIALSHSLMLMALSSQLPCFFHLYLIFTWP